MKYYLKAVLLFSGLFFIGCNNDREISLLLQSEDKEDVILGSYEAGISGEKLFMEALLKDSYDSRRSTNIRFKGISVYQAKMGALKKIVGKDPPVKITHEPDSTVIKFYLGFLNR